MKKDHSKTTAVERIGSNPKTPASKSRAKSTYSMHVQLRLTPEQHEVYVKLGQTEWLRRVLDDIPALLEDWNIKIEDLAPDLRRPAPKGRTPEGCFAVGIPADQPTLAAAASLSNEAAFDADAPKVNVFERAAPNRAKSIAFEAPDDAMKDAGISKGDLLVIEPGDVAYGDLCLARVESGLVVRRLMRRGLSMELRAQNAEGSFESIKPSLTGSEMIGRVVSVVKRL